MIIYTIIVIIRQYFSIECLIKLLLSAIIFTKSVHIFGYPNE
jgi:hypothetical protein